MNEAETKQILKLLAAKERLKPKLQYYDMKRKRTVTVYDPEDPEARRILFGIRDFIQNHGDKVTRLAREREQC